MNRYWSVIFMTNLLVAAPADAGNPARAGLASVRHRCVAGVLKLLSEGTVAHHGYTGSSRLPPTQHGALPTDAVILDTNAAIAVGKEQRRAKLGPKRERSLRQLREHGLSDFYVNDLVLAEAGNEYPKGAAGIQVMVNRDGAAYRSLVAKLRAANLGKEKISDLHIVADVFFARTQKGVIAKFATADAGIYNSLARIAGIELNGKPLSERFPNGLRVNLDGRSLILFSLD